MDALSLWLPTRAACTKATFREALGGEDAETHSKELSPLGAEWQGPLECRARAQMAHWEISVDQWLLWWKRSTSDQHIEDRQRPWGSGTTGGSNCTHTGGPVPTRVRESHLSGYGDAGAAQIPATLSPPPPLDRLMACQ